MVKFIQGYLFFLAFIWLTGGFIINAGFGKIEFSSLDPWVAALGLMLLATKDRKRILESAFLKLNRFELSHYFFFFFCLLFVGHAFRFFSIETHMYDLLAVTQPLFSGFSTPLLKCDICVGGSYFGEHISPILLFFVPVFSLFKSDVFLFFIQTLMIGLPVLWVVKRGLISSASQKGILLFLVLLCLRPLRDSVVWDLREDHMAFFMFSISLLSLHFRKFPFYFLFLTLGLLAKENTGLVTLFLFFPLWKEGHKKSAIATALLSIFWTVLCFKFLIPHFSIGQENAHNIVRRLPGLGDTPGEILKTVLSSPIAWWMILTKYFFTYSTLKYCILLFGPVAYFASKKPVWLWPVIPGILMNIVSETPGQRSLQFHYELIFLPFLIWSTLKGFEIRLQKNAWVLGLFLAFLFSGRWPGWQVSSHFPEMNELRSSLFLNSIETGETVAGNGFTLGQLSHLKDFRALVPDENQIDRTGLSDHQLADANVFVLDKTVDFEREYARILQATQIWKPLGSDPGNRFIVLEHQP